MATKLYIAYCEENKSVANHIANTLGKANFTFTQLSSTQTSTAEGLTFLISSAKTPGLLLLSDNLLKDEDCILNMLNFLQNSAVAETMQIVVIDGQYANGDVETSFDRVSSVIRYMNFWQEKYLEMRKQKRTIDASQEEAFNIKLQNVKEISSEIGDFLRLVRNKDFWTYDQLVFNNFEIFFKKYGNNTQHQNFIKVAGQSPKTVNPTPSAAPEKTSTATAIPTSSSKPTIVPPTPSSPVDKPMKLVAESMEEISSKIPKTSDKIPSLKKPTEAPTINDLFQQKEELKDKVSAVSKSNPVKVNSDIPVMSIAEKAMMKEEAEIDAVLKEVDFVETKNITTQINKNETPNPVSTNDLNTFKTVPTPPLSLNDKLRAKEVSEINEKAVKSIQSETPANIVMEDEPNVPEVPVSETPPIIETTSVEPIIEKVIIEEELSPELPTVEEPLDEEEDFDVMDGIEVEDITDELEEEEEEEIEDEEIEEENDFESIYAVEELETPDFSETEEIEEMDLESYNMNISAALVAAGAFMNNGDHEKGIQAFEKILEENPENVEVRYQYAYSLKEEANDIEKASSQFEKIIKLDHVHYPSYRALAEISEQNNDFLLAKSYYEKVVSLNPEEKGIYYKLGLITAGFYAEKPKLAAKYFKKSILQDPTNSDAYYRLGMIQTDLQGKDNKALVNFHKTLKISPNHPKVNFNLATLYHKLEDQENALFYYEKACLANPELKTEENDMIFLNQEEEEIHSQDLKETTLPPAYNNDKTILITGATSGIGRATARKFAEHGFRIIITGRRTDRLEALQAEFAESYKDTKVKTLSFDVRSIEEVKSMINNLEEEWRDIDVLINNAGLAKGFAPIHEGELEHWETMIDTNIKGLLYLTRAVAPHMVERKSGHIINICSTAGKEVYPNGNVYCATKHAVDALTKAMRLDLYKHNIRVGQVSPAHVEETEFAYVRYEDEEKANIYNDFQPLKSSDVADALFYIVNTPDYVNVEDIVLMGKQQANSNHIDRSGRKED